MVETVCDARLSEFGLDWGKRRSAAAKLGAHVWEYMHPCPSEFELTLVPGYLENLFLIRVVVEPNYHGSGTVAGFGIRSRGSVSAVQHRRISYLVAQNAG